MLKYLKNIIKKYINSEINVKQKKNSNKIIDLKEIK